MLQAIGECSGHKLRSMGLTTKKKTASNINIHVHSLGAGDTQESKGCVAILPVSRPILIVQPCFVLGTPNRPAVM